jgi:hypothetical protein
VQEDCPKLLPVSPMVPHPIEKLLKWGQILIRDFVFFSDRKDLCLNQTFENLLEVPMQKQNKEEFSERLYVSPEEDSFFENLVCMNRISPECSQRAPVFLQKQFYHRHSLRISS